MNSNFLLKTECNNYMMQPGDCTLYRFSFFVLVESVGDSYIISSGVDNPENFVQLFINMPGGTGITTLRVDDLQSINRNPQLHMERVFNYAYSHGMQNVDRYTLVAVLLAMSILVSDINAINDASNNMLLARKFSDLIGGGN